MQFTKCIQTYQLSSKKHISGAYKQSTIVEIIKTKQSYIKFVSGGHNLRQQKFQRPNSHLLARRRAISDLRQQKFQRPNSHDRLLSGYVLIYDSRNFKDLIASEFPNNLYSHLRQQKFQRPNSLFIYGKGNISFEFQQVIITS